MGVEGTNRQCDRVGRQQWVEMRVGGCEASAGAASLNTAACLHVFLLFKYSKIKASAPAVPSNPRKPERNGMTQSPTKYVTQIRKQEGWEGEGRGGER